MKETSTQKIDKLLGITTDIDQYLNTLSVDSVTDQFKQVDDNVKQAIYDIDTQMSSYNIADIQNVNIPAIENSLNDIHELINQSKEIIRHVHDNIVTTSLLDAEAIDSFSHLLETAHVTISEYIQLYKDRLNFLDKIKYALFQQEQKKELMLLKHKLDLEKLSMKTKSDDAPIDTVPYSIEDITRVMDDKEKEDIEMKLNEN